MMGRRILKYGLMASLLLMFMGMLSPVSAHAVTGDHVQLTITADKEQYEQGDTATIRIGIQNCSEKSVEDVAYTVTLPDEMKCVEGSQTSGKVESLDAGESYTATVTAEVLAPVAGNSVEAIPQTGDSVLALVAACLIGALVLFVTAAAWKRYSKIAISVLMAFGLGATVCAFLPRDVYAAENTYMTTQSSCEVIVSGRSRTVKAVVSYLVSSGQNESGVEDATMTRAEWVSALLDGTGASYLETNAEPYDDINGHGAETDIKTAWVLGILPDDTGNFSPDTVATRDFVYSVAVLASDLDTSSSTLNTADADETEHPELIAAAIDGGLLIPDSENCVYPDKPFTSNVADALIERIVEMANAEQGSGEDGSEPIASWEYRKDVTVITDYSEANGSYLVSDAASIQAGDRVAFEPTDQDATGGAGEVTAVTPTQGGYRIDVEQADDPREIFTSIFVSAQGMPIDSSTVELADGIEYDDDAASYATRDRHELGTLKLKLAYPVKGESEGGLQLAGSIEMTPAIDAGLDWKNLFGGPKSFELGVAQSMTVWGDIEAETKDDVSIRLNKKPIKVPIVPGVYVGVNLDFKVTAEGKVGLEATVDTALGVRYTKKRGLKPYGEFDAGANFGFEGELKVGASPWAGLYLVKTPIIDIAADGGLAGKGSVKLRETGMVCNDITLYAYAKISTGENSNLQEALRLTAEYEFWDEDDSPFRENVHWENGNRVLECTYKEKPEEPDNPGGSDTSGEPDNPDNPSDDPGETPASEFTYEIAGAGGFAGEGVYITGYTGASDVVSIPETIDGQDVVAFWVMHSAGENDGIKRIHVPSGTHLELLWYGSNVWEMADEDSGNMSSLETVTVGEGATVGWLLLEGTRVSSLDVSDASVREVELANNPMLTDLAVSEGTGIERLYSKCTPLAQVDFSVMSDLKNLSLKDANLKTLDLRSNSSLQMLECTYCGIEKLLLPSSGLLDRLDCRYNHISNVGELDSLKPAGSSEWLTSPQS